MSPKNSTNTSALLSDFIEAGKHIMGKEAEMEMRDGHEHMGRQDRVLSPKPLCCPQQSWLHKSFLKVHLGRSLKGL